MVLYALVNSHGYYLMPGAIKGDDKWLLEFDLTCLTRTLEFAEEVAKEYLPHLQIRKYELTEITDNDSVGLKPVA